MEKELSHFFNTSLTNALRNLKEDSKAKWGTMTAKQMLIHLIQSSKMMHFGNNTLLIKEEYVEKAIAFLYTDKAIKKGLVVPNDIGFNFTNNNNNNEEIEGLKAELINSSNNMLAFLIENTEFQAIHPYFGELNTKQWILFQKKHYSHHLSQFDLL
jgi:oxepin-CoA hydrolase/3-oxo-5,6-dehydrosuberyl-CoA semialdehyde dehydrogenase